MARKVSLFRDSERRYLISPDDGGPLVPMRGVGSMRDDLARDDFPTGRFQRPDAGPRGHEFVGVGSVPVNVTGKAELLLHVPSGRFLLDVNGRLLSERRGDPDPGDPPTDPGRLEWLASFPVRETPDFPPEKP